MSAVGEEPVLRKYRLIAEIGRGGMADVHLAVVQGPAGFNKLVVIKRTLAELAQDPEFVAMFLDEARLAARLNHPNVVQTHEVGQDGNRYFIAMEYLDGQPLNRVRSRAGAAFNAHMQARVLADVLMGLHHAHELCDFDGSALGVVHRDATPQNVFVTYDGVVKVVDFGIAKAVDSSSETRAGVVKGKVTYMAPEQARGQKVDRRADVFAAGVMLWEAIANRRMWKGVPDLAVVHELIAGKVPSIRDVVPDVPEPLAKICERALSPGLGDRYPTALAMHDDLDSYLNALPERISAREVGKFVAERFAEDRAKVKALIENQLRDVRWTGVYPKMTATDLPKIDPGQVVVTPTGPKPIDSSTTNSRVAESRYSGSFPSSITNAGGITNTQTTAKPNRLLVLVTVGAAAAVAVILVGVRVLGPVRPPPAQPAAAAPTEAKAAQPATPVQTATDPAPGQEAVKLTIHVSPANAKVFLDDMLLSIGTFDNKIAKTAQPRKVRVEASHYGTKTETVTLTGDVMLSFALEKDSAPPPPPGAYVPRPRPTPDAPTPQVATPPPTPQPPPPAVPQGPQKPKRGIDSDSPYAQ